MAEIRVGVSGWRYPRWRGDFYPKGLVQRRELEYLAARTTSLELNGSFYSLLRPATYRQVAEQVPADFPVAVKGSRFITHLKRLNDIETALANFLASGVLALGDKLGPFLWQLPAGLKYDERQVGDFLDRLPRTAKKAAELAAGHDDKVPEPLTEKVSGQRLRHALEVRDKSFCGEDAIGLLRKKHVALVVADSPGKWPYAEERTSDFMYVRLHGHTELYTSGYSSASLDQWAEKTTRWCHDGLDVYVYFDNDSRGRAPHDAVALLERLRPAQE